MRDKDRIQRLLLKLGQYWSKRPDLRLGQLMFNINYMLGYGNDVFYVEDDKIEEWLDKNL